ncbi:MAG: murein hydrolase activator EnvC family protein [Oceanococcus sp.]
MRNCLALFLFLPLLALAQPELTQKKAELNQLKSRIAQITRQLESDKQTESALSDDVERIEKRLSSLQKAARLAAQDLQVAQKTADKLEAERKQLQQSLRKHYRALQAQLRAAHVIGRQARTRMLLSQQDPGRLARLQTYMEIFQRSYEKKITAFQDVLDQLEIKNQESAQALAELKVLKKSQDQALAAISTQRGQRQSKLDEVQKRLGAGGNTLRSLRNQQSQLESLIQQLNETLQSSRLPPLSGDFARHKGQLYRPVPGKTLAHYNAQKPDGETRWKGIWLAAAEGDPVRAVAPGRVVYVGWMHHYGLLMVVDHGQGWFSLYGHNQSASRSVGDSLAAGDVLARAGDTGGHNKPGVYLEIRNGRKTHNPARWLRALSN